MKAKGKESIGAVRIISGKYFDTDGEDFLNLVSVMDEGLADDPDLVLATLAADKPVVVFTEDGQNILLIGDGSFFFKGNNEFLKDKVTNISLRYAPQYMQQQLCVEFADGDKLWDAVYNFAEFETYSQIPIPTFDGMVRFISIDRDIQWDRVLEYSIDTFELKILQQFDHGAVILASPDMSCIWILYGNSILIVGSNSTTNDLPIVRIYPDEEEVEIGISAESMRMPYTPMLLS